MRPRMLSGTARVRRSQQRPGGRPGRRRPALEPTLRRRRGSRPPLRSTSGRPARPAARPTAAPTSASTRTARTSLIPTSPGRGAGAERDVDRAGPQPRGRWSPRQRLPPRRRQLLLVVLDRWRAHVDGLHAADGLHPRGRLRWRRAPVLAGRRRHVGGVGHEGQRLPVLPDVQPRRGRRRTTRTCRARSTSSARPAAAARRGTSRRARSPSSTTSAAAGDGAARQAAADGRRPPRAARSRTASTSPGRCSPPTARATSTRPTRATTASTSARRSSSARDSALCTNDLGVADAAGTLQHEPVLAAVHRARRRAVRRVGQLQPHRRAARRG